MLIRVAENSGFCFGVKRAINMALAARPHGGQPPTYILGALVHNPFVMEELVRQGFVHVDSPQAVTSGTIVLPSHGVSPSVRSDLGTRGIDVIDATCPFVARAQQDVESLSCAGRTVFIVGDKGHREVAGLAGHSTGRTEVIGSVDEAMEVAASLHQDVPVAVVAQTTQDRTAFRQVVDVLESRFADVVVRDTICTATRERQRGVMQLAPEVDVMVVVGGRNSANTRRLFEISRSLGTKTYHIESADELGEVTVAHGSRIGVAAGASTPGWAIKEVVSKMEEKTMGLNVEPEETTSEEAEPNQSSRDETEGTVKPVDSTSAPGQDAPETGNDESTQEADVHGEASGAEEEPVEAPGEAADDEQGSPRVAEDAESTPEADRVEAPSEPQEAKAPEDATMSEALNSEHVPKEGEIIPGRVVQVNEDEVLVDIGYKSEAVVPKRELSVRSFSHPSDVVSSGDEVYCVVLSVDAEGEGAVVVSKKRADLIRAWEKVEAAFSEGQTIEGKVVDVVKGGVTVDIGLRGFVPASQIALRPVANLRSVLGQTLTMKVLEVEKDRNNVVLSQRAFLEEKLADAKARVFETVKDGDLVDGTVTRLTSFGAFVDIGDGVEGLLHVSDISWNRIGHPGQVLKEGQAIRVVVLNLDADRERISLGLKQTQDDPWTKVPTKYPVGTVTDGKITRLTDFGAFVELEPGIEGLVHVSQISRERVEKPSDVLREGQIIQIKVISLRQEQRRIGLSIREVEDDITPAGSVSGGRGKAKQEDTLGGATIGELVGDILKQHELAGQPEDDSSDADTANTAGEDSDTADDDAAESDAGVDAADDDAAKSDAGVDAADDDAAKSDAGVDAADDDAAKSDADSDAADDDAAKSDAGVDAADDDAAKSDAGVDAADDDSGDDKQS